MTSLEVTLSYNGALSDKHAIDFYDISKALLGFQRTLALTTHLILNDEIITQAPSLKGAQILLAPPEEGSWKAVAWLILGGVWTMGTVSKDTPIGNIISSAYDYVVSESLGFHVDYSKTLGQQYEEYKRSHPKAKNITADRFDSLIEKCHVAIQDMHRPIIISETAKSANISFDLGGKVKAAGPELNIKTFEHLGEEEFGKKTYDFSGNVTGYNSNTFRGRIYIPSLHRIVPFEIADHAKNTFTIEKIAGSLYVNAQKQKDHLILSDISFSGIKVTTKTGILKRIIINDVKY
ncbi:hypothetical protein HLH34_18825 [Gluconacetobacter azotocaptans]|uniref:Uncharacterized protein n=1 Tax=Gluconacetobacter azotocaptans TaxID=142834 RepID=A0A7W4JW34_9PROT|nr:hypothetical protein [Gluconacetobacter azotocaptans]MBB2191988.1 hypothetical protein [Gluconacetobacter azotocaptans]GBQ28787.1 hypothetical protein AA13594_1126 [Gluconacetobacter azotocaptans DSM 13594]